MMKRALWITLIVLALWRLGTAQTAYSLSGATLPSGCSTGNVFWLQDGVGTITPYYCTAGTWSTWNAAIPSGTLLMIASGTCPSGYTESSALNGKTLVGTLAANKDVGTTGGADTITPAGTNGAPVFTGSALGTHLHATGTYATSAHSGTAVADHASHTHTYTEVITHTHAVTSVGSLATGAATNLTGASDTSSTTATAAAPAGAVSTGTTAGPSATLTHGVTQPSAHTLSGSSEAVSAGTPTGTNSAPVFTGTQFDNRSAFVRVIFCTKN
jgi:hypothetical protein